MNSVQSSMIVELHFPLKGKSLASEHAYPLYGAISKHITLAHNAEWLGIHSIAGSKLKPGLILLTPNSLLKLRLPSDKVPAMYKLAGARLDVAGHPIQCGIPQISMISSSQNLRSRLVFVKEKGSEGTSADSKTFLEAVKRQVSTLAVAADVELERKALPDQHEPYARRILKIKGVTLTGYGVVLRNLTDEDSLKIQTTGLGGRRRMGCGLFDPFLD